MLSQAPAQQEVLTIPAGVVFNGAAGLNDHIGICPGFSEKCRLIYSRFVELCMFGEIGVKNGERLRKVAGKFRLKIVERDMGYTVMRSCRQGKGAGGVVAGTTSSEEAPVVVGTGESSTPGAGTEGNNVTAVPYDPGKTCDRLKIGLESESGIYSPAPPSQVLVVSLEQQCRVAVDEICR